ncbi:hypothetical protein NW768_007463 [Fusarium equiseti]|uniref:Altered inheritance of mitochondria protein 24, mitochondrial n=1 Tax=Fusarium equiseti TaxID=61235 RepID=A0ABQ8R7U9_FUSEQ|nr:hypothetical protein NW768_007463 [Fusarium equiseti]
MVSRGCLARDVDAQYCEEHIVDTGYLVAWICGYSIEKAGGGTMTGFKTGEGLVRRFKSPGSVSVKTQKMAEFQLLIKATVANIV